MASLTFRHDLDLAAFARDGFVVIRHLFSEPEVEELIRHFMELRELGFDTGEEIDHRLLEVDPLRTWPRLMHPHRRDPVSKRLMLDPRIRAVLRTLMQDEPLAAQSMMYYKPPGSRGHALHQDQFYLRVSPGTCMAAWIALDPADLENGGMRVVPGLGDLPLLCVQPADESKSWSQVVVPLPEDARAEELELEPGDTLFFSGWTPHGSLPNVSKDRMRRCFIGHYIPAAAKQVSSWYLPLVDFDGKDVVRDAAPSGGACGVWTESEAGRLEVTMVDPDFQPQRAHE